LNFLIHWECKMSIPSSEKIYDVRIEHGVGLMIGVDNSVKGIIRIRNGLIDIQSSDESGIRKNKLGMILYFILPIASSYMFISGNWNYQLIPAIAIFCSWPFLFGLVVLKDYYRTKSGLIYSSDSIARIYYNSNRIKLKKPYRMIRFSNYSDFNDFMSNYLQEF